MKTKTLYLGKVDLNDTGVARYPVELKIELRHKIGQYQTVDLVDITEYVELSIVGAVWKPNRSDWACGGQITDMIAGFFPDDPVIQELCVIWERWHLNGMIAGTRAQEAAIKSWQAESGQRYDYDIISGVLADVNLLVDNGYSYGESWLVEQLSKHVIDFIEGLE